MLAERDRAFLKQLRLNREYEAELMKDVPGWEVGTWFGQKVFATEPDDKWVIDPRGRPTVTAGSDHYFRPFLSPSVRHHI